MTRRKSPIVEVILPPIPKRNHGDTLEGCAHRHLIGVFIGTGKGVPK